ncbi:MAG: 4'-phosphopantetheinyl transferase superfamily protein [Nevskiaceae bacterium]|jgi:4'-phosphopantetheinyl transferase EntD|nr:4'-phosphopantetheinyl transferase superfamily protein [Nevskiaceae bacterium]
MTARRSAWIESLLDANANAIAIAAERLGTGDPATLLPEESAIAHRWAPKRIAEFAAGRECARLAMQALGLPPQPMPPQPDRRPRWPEGLTGSITHCQGFAAAAVARTGALRSLGIDAELVGALEPDLWPRILGDEEQQWLARQPSPQQRLWATVIFSAKEAWYKCQNPLTGWFLEFHEARIHVQNDPGGQGEALFDLLVESRGIRLPGRGGVREGVICTAFTWRE